MVRDKPQMRLSFSLQSLFIINLAFAFVFAVIRFMASEIPGVHILISPAIWILGSLGTVVMTSMGDALGKVAGSFFGSIMGIGIWACGLAVIPILENSFVNGLAVHYLAMTVNLAAILALDVKRARDDRRPALEGTSLTTTLLENQRLRQQTDSSTSPETTDAQTAQRAHGSQRL